MRRWGNAILTAVLMVILFFGILYVNASAPRANVDTLSQETVPANELVLLEGGEVVSDETGWESRRFTLRWEGAGCLFMPIADNGTLLVNGQEADELHDGKQRLFQFVNGKRESGIYNVVIRSDDGILDRYGGCIYLGPLEAVNACVSSQLISRYLAAGICLCIFISSLALYLWKRSERYLFFLALYALLRFLSSQDALGLGIFIREDAALFQAVDRFVFSNDLYQVIYQPVVAWLEYQIFKRYLSAELWGRPYMVYVLWADVALLVGTVFLHQTQYVTYLYFIILYSCHIICIQRDQGLSEADRHILSVTWVFAVTYEVFYQLSALNAIPHGDLDLKTHILPIQTCIYVIGFFIVACHRFAAKFQEADDLNLHLEAQIREKTREQTAFVRSMLHNLKSPLFTISGYADMARATLGQEGGQAERYLDKVGEKAKYVGGLLDHLFLVTQMDAGQVVYQRVPTDLAAVVRAVWESAQLKGGAKGVQVTLEGPEHAEITGDPNYLQQALQCIADNAVEHTDAGHIRIGLERAGEGWQVTFSDTGRGIPPEDLPKIFTRYYSNHGEKRASSGLGLTIAQEIIAHHGGEIRADSRPGQGSVFTVTLPGGVC